MQLRGWCCPSVPVSCADLIRIPYLHLKSTVYDSNLHTIQELKDSISQAVAAIKITMLHRVYRNMIRRVQLCIDAGGNHLQHLLLWYILSTFGYGINFCVYAMLRIRVTISWPILYKKGNYLAVATHSTIIKLTAKSYSYMISFFINLWHVKPDGCHAQPKRVALLDDCTEVLCIDWLFYCYVLC
jgi:hypothetical protein